MIITKDNEIESEKMNAHGGVGLMDIKFAFKGEQGYGNQNDSGWNCFAIATLPIGATAGYHKHSDTDEFFYVLEGEARLVIDGEERKISKGDIILTKVGSSHGIKDVSKELKFVVIEVYRKNK